MKQRLHYGCVARVADGLVVEVSDPTLERLAKCSQATRRIEGLVSHAVQRELLPLLQWWNITEFSINDGFAGLAIFVDNAVSAPGQIVVQCIRRISGQS